MKKWGASQLQLESRHLSVTCHNGELHISLLPVQTYESVSFYQTEVNSQCSEYDSTNFFFDWGLNCKF